MITSSVTKTCQKNLTSNTLLIRAPVPRSAISRS